jgi:polyhydroxybutyrate depolymerase
MDRFENGRMCRLGNVRRRWSVPAVFVTIAVACGALTALGMPSATASVPASASTAPTNGCGRPVKPGVTTKAITVDGVPREYLLEITASARARRPAPLIFNFHGLGSNMTQQAAYSELSDKGGRAGYVVITPNGAGSGLKSWKFPPISDSDVRFVKAMLSTTESALCIDRNRVYATGISAGGIFATTLPCAVPGTFAAIAPVAGVNATKVCRAGTPRVSVLAFHGTADPIVPYNGGPFFSGVSRARLGASGSPTAGLGASLQAHPVPDAIASWAAFDGCSTHPKVNRVADDVQRTTEQKCRAHLGVALYTVEGGGHTWPGAAKVTRSRLGSVTASIDASELMLDFFHAHPRVH